MIHIIIIILLLLMAGSCYHIISGGMLDPKYHRLVMYECNQLRMNGYTVDYNEENDELNISKDDKNYIINITGYPFIQPSINGQKDYLPVEKPYWSPIIKINNIIDFYDTLDYGSNDVKSARSNKINTVLIFCHNRNVRLFAPNSDGTPTDKHWMNDDIYELARKAGISDPTQCLVKCVDMRASKFDATNNVVVADAFGDGFISKNEGIYDAVAIPDCGGIWWENGDVDLWVSLINKASRLLVSGGTLLVSKFVSRKSTDREQSEYVQDVALKLREIGSFEYVNVIPDQRVGYLLELKKK